jgi:hypothetical protein
MQNNAFQGAESRPSASAESYVVTRRLAHDDSDQIDSALQSALVNPRERMALFQIEDAVLSFMKSK